MFRHEGKLLVKRIKAVGGDAIIHKGKRVVVPEGCFYVAGDDKEKSIDSRVWVCPWVEEKKALAKMYGFFNK